MNREELKKYKEIKEEQRIIKYQLEEVETSLLNISAKPLTGVHNKAYSSDDRLVTLMNKKQQLIDRLNEAGERLIEQHTEIEKAIEDIEDRSILRMRYILGWKIEDIAKEMNYSVRWVNREIKKALERLEEI